MKHEHPGPGMTMTPTYCDHMLWQALVDAKIISPEEQTLEKIEVELLADKVAKLKLTYHLLPHHLEVLAGWIKVKNKPQGT